MDSVTQIALGAAVGVAVMGRRTAVWKSALWGAVAGTLPDLDAFIDHGDAILNMTRHRAESHALFYLTLAAPALAWLVSRLHGEPALFRRWWLALWLVLITHPLLDTMTVYGTQLLQPFSSHPFGVGSVFIIDPLYTLPLVAGVLAALWRAAGKGLRWNLAGLALSTLYLGWSVFAQQHVERLAQASLAASGIQAQGLLVTPAPFNTVLWRLVAVTPTHYHEAYRSLLDGDAPITWRAHERGAELIAAHASNPHVERVARFSHGFFSLGNQQGRLTVTDLRMGQEPYYTFRFDVGPLPATTPVRQVSLPGNEASKSVLLRQRPDLAGALPWLWSRLLGRHDDPLPVHRQETVGAASLTPRLLP